jgi:hypothetical protein
MVGYLLDTISSLWDAWTNLLRALPFWDPYGAMLVPLLLGALATLAVLAERRRRKSQPA